ncbi:hypothetical protein H0H81_002898 [Sphagnurus paluster]|uniref:Phosphoglucomutase n=1 Tax=Sphagnurus paluster TaxID=117069 RepID=A0A9P7K685_9AGAR|nr:hypothetical protein H0H81_002898 [Sphagnurus paluster]
MHEITSRIDWRISLRQLELLRQAAQKLVPDAKLSLQDCLTAYFVAIFSRHRPRSIDKITNAASYREVRAPFVQADVAGNAILIIPTEKIEDMEATNIAAIARKIRKSYQHYLEPQVLEEMISVTGHLMLLAANEQRPPFFGIEPTTLSVNSSIRLNWASTNFGSAGPARFYTSGVSRFYLRACKANPDMDSGESCVENEQSRAEIQSLWDTGNTDELEKRMRVRIEFGTAGKSSLDSRSQHLNTLANRSARQDGARVGSHECPADLIVIQASQGLCAYVAAHVDGAAKRGIVIGYDHRHNSERWARLTAAAFIANGHKVYLLQGIVHTPMYQDHLIPCPVYWENAVQIIGPHDEGISRAIKANLEPKSWDADAVLSSPLFEDPTAQMHSEYFASLQSLNQSPTANGALGVRFVNTSMHGVSDRVVAQAFSVFGFAPYTPVAEQQAPDPEFPTDLALQTADRVGAQKEVRRLLAHTVTYLLRRAARGSASGVWTTFTGDQLGVLFGHRTFELYKASGKAVERLAMVASTVSSKMLETVARVEGFRFVECLTGFKFIGNTALDLVAAGYEVPFGYEEAIGFMFGHEIRDKDGVAATVVFAELVTALHAQGKTVEAHLQELYDRYGYFETSNSYFICTDPGTIDKIFARIRSYTPGSPSPCYPREIGGLTVTSVVDLTTGYDSTNAPSYKPSLPLSSGHMIQFRAENRADGTRIVLTTRCALPHLSILFALMRPQYERDGAQEGSGKDAAAVGALLPKVVAELGEAWLEASKHGLGRA